MTRIALGIEYLGCAFHGWQYQNESLPTVEKALSLAIAKVADHPVSLTCAGRTDRGVHALAQVVHFDSSSKRALDAWLYGINRYLPAQIAVTWVRVVRDDFHARFSALARQYCYIIDNSRTRPAIRANQVSWYPRHLDVELMSQGACYLIGEHDFSSFRASGCQAKSPVRNLYLIDIKRFQQYILTTIKANAFLHHMVRNIMGVLVAIGEGKRSPSWVKEVLLSRDRTQASVTAKADGLYLQLVDYPDYFSLPNQSRDWPFFMLS